jgi:hypothetical protein
MGLMIQSSQLPLTTTPPDTLVAQPPRFKPRFQPMARDKTHFSGLTRPIDFPFLDLFRVRKADFAAFFQGFHTGSDIKISAKGFIGSGTVKGAGKVKTLTAEALQMDLQIKSPLGNGELNLDLRKEGNGYRLLSPQNWPATVAQQGNVLTIANQTNPEQKITITHAGNGTVDVLTKGFGYDGKTLVAKALN